MPSDVEEVERLPLGKPRFIYILSLLDEAALKNFFDALGLEGREVEQDVALISGLITDTFRPQGGGYWPSQPLQAKFIREHALAESSAQSIGDGLDTQNERINEFSHQVEGDSPHHDRRQDRLLRSIGTVVYFGLIGAGLGAIWSAALPGAGFTGAIWGGIISVIVTYMVVGLGGRPQGTLTQFRYLSSMSSIAVAFWITGLLVWLITFVTR